MPFPSGIYPIGGPILDISGGPLTPSAALRAAGVVSVRGGKLTRVNAAGDGWEEVPGHVISATAPTALFEGLLWYDTALKTLKHYNGTAFVAVVGTAGVPADGSIAEAQLAAAVQAKLKTDAQVTTLAAAAALARYTAAEKTKLGASPADASITPAKLDAANATKQDALLTRLNALRRDLNNLATLSPSAKRAALIKLGAIVEGGRPKPSADYSARLWIDDTNEQAYICRNFIEYTAAVMGGFADATIPSTVQVVEFVGDLIAPTMIGQWAYTYGDNHFWVGTTGPGAGYHFSQTDDHTVLAALVTGASSVGEWLGQASWDGGATARLPTAGLAANREYFFWHTGTKTIRRLNPGSYVAANSAIDHWKWVPVSANAADLLDWAKKGNIEQIPADKLPAEATSVLYLADTYSMPGGSDEAEDIEGGTDGKYYKTVYGIEHKVRFNSITLQGKGPTLARTYRLRLTKGVNASDTDESTITPGAILWPVTNAQYTSSEFLGTTETFIHKYTFPYLTLNRGEYLIVEFGRHAASDSRCFVRVVRDLTEHQGFNAFRFIGSGTSNDDIYNSPGLDNVEWSDAGLWVKIEYQVEYDVHAAIAAHGNDDFAASGVFALANNKNLSLQLTRELGGVVDVPAIDLSVLPAGLTDSEVTTIADAQALANYTAAEKTKLSTAAPLANPVFTGVPRAPHPTDTSVVTQIATKKYVDDNAGGGGGSPPSRTALITTATTFTSAKLITLAESIVSGMLLEFVIQDGATIGTDIRSVGYIMADLILGLEKHTQIPAQGTALGILQDRVVIKIHQEGDPNYGHDSIHIWRGATDDKLYMSSGRNTSCDIRIYYYQLGGGAAGGATGAGGTSGSSTTVNTRRLQLILHQWGATQPADPTQVWAAAGWSGVVDGNAASSWVEDEPTVVPAGTHWIALANAYSGDAGATWANYGWSVFSVGAGYLAEQYSEDAESWHATRTDYDFWMRLRRPDGTWTGSIALKAVPWQPILDWADVYRPNYDVNATVAWKFGINLVDLLTYNDLVLEARFFYYTNGPPDDFSAVARGVIPTGTAKKDGVLGTYTPTTELRWQTLPQDFLLTDWASTVPARVARRLGVFRAVLDRDNGLSVVLGESARSTPDDQAYQRATICFGLQTSSIGAYNSTINAVAIHVPVGTQAYSRTQIRILGR